MERHGTAWHAYPVRPGERTSSAGFGGTDDTIVKYGGFTWRGVSSLFAQSGPWGLGPTRSRLPAAGVAPDINPTAGSLIPNPPG